MKLKCFIALYKFNLSKAKSPSLFHKLIRTCPRRPSTRSQQLLLLLRDQVHARRPQTQPDQSRLQGHLERLAVHLATRLDKLHVQDYQQPRQKYRVARLPVQSTRSS